MTTAGGRSGARLTPTLRSRSLLESGGLALLSGHGTEGLVTGHEDSIALKQCLCLVIYLAHACLTGS